MAVLGELADLNTICTQRCMLVFSVHCLQACGLHDRRQHAASKHRSEDVCGSNMVSMVAVYQRLRRGTATTCCDNLTSANRSGRRNRGIIADQCGSNKLSMSPSFPTEFPGASDLEQEQEFTPSSAAALQGLLVRQCYDVQMWGLTGDIFPQYIHW